MKDQEADLAQLSFEANAQKYEKKPNAYKDLNFRYYFFLDFFMLQLTCLLFTFFMLGIKDFVGEKKMQTIFEYYWYILVIPAGLVVLEIISVYFLYKKIIMLGRPWIILCLYFFFVLCFAFMTCFCCLNSVITCMFFEGLLTLNILTFIFMNSIKALEDKNIIKIFVLYINTFSVVITYIVIVNKRYVVFFILATSSVLYFSYMINYYKRMIVINFPSVEKDAKKALGALDDEAADVFLGSSDQKAEENKEREVLNKFSTSILTKISFVVSFADTTVFNFS